MSFEKVPLINSAHGSDTRNIINELIKLFNSMGYTYDEALQKAHNVLNEAQQTNDMNVDVQQQINNIIDGVADPNSEIAQARGSFEVLNGRLKAHENATETTNETIGISILRFPRLALEVDDLQRFQRAIDHLGSLGGGRLLIPRGSMPYRINFRNNSTITNPTRVKITHDNIEIVGVGSPVIEMQGLTLDYLHSIDDYASSGRDIFTVFSFCGVRSPKVIGMRFEGEYEGGETFRYKSPRAIAVAFKGCIDSHAENIYGEGIFGNVINAVNSYIDYDAPYSNTYNTTIVNSTARRCLENGFNMMGGTYNSKFSGIFSTECANGLESASDGFTLDGSALTGNMSSNLALSGKNQVINGGIYTAAKFVKKDGTIDESKGYGIIVTGGEGVFINGGIYGDNFSYGVYLYPGVKNIKIDNAEIANNALTASTPAAFYIAGTESNKIENVKVSGCIISGNTGGVINFADDVSFVGNSGNFTGSYSLSFSASSTGSIAKNNDFDKSVSMTDTSGEVYNNGGYKIVERSSLPTEGTWDIGDIVKNAYPSIGSWLEARCLQAGSYGTSEEPIFQVTQQNGVANNISSPPIFVGQQAVTGGSNPAFYVAVNTSSVDDWMKVSNT
ncbi:hypothetical protein [Salinicoccus halodurans]|uniref:Right handed beta helix domain-containing protein n=1 Tax=Salinicoccus halodurans TaxID=407035 RepID=A0A0F7HLV0_9STAP|nr:hypothetical protein [Salinicoccus halodurans]AKG74356.1 hypothetical protein AAT16_08990 [Salinicoccus halodurans]SFK94929.1 hypothetical protein SAMN05216235_2695 [Salinicoccus halodurans]